MNKHLFYHGQLTTLDATYPQAEAIYVEDGRIVALGTDQELLRQFAHGDVVKTDLQGGYGYPGWVDSHLHLAMVGEKLGQINLSACHSKQELLAAIRQQAIETKTGDWILGYGWNEEHFADSIPTLDELNQASLGHPLFIGRVCQHVFLVNDVAYRVAKVPQQAEDPIGGAYGRDHRGHLNGWIYDQATARFRAAQPTLERHQHQQQIAQAMKMALKQGLTGVHTDDLREIKSVAKLMDIYQELQQSGVYLRTHHLLYHPYLSEWDELGAKSRKSDEWFSWGAVKIFADGTIGGRTARLAEPYSDDPEQRGLLMHSSEQFGELARQATQRNLPIAVHAIGDEAIALTLQVMNDHRRSPALSTPLRHRLIHASLLQPALLQLLQQMPIVVDIQPHFVINDFSWIIDRIGKERLSYMYPWQSMIAAGVNCAGGSDAPIEPLSPLTGFHAAVSSRDRSLNLPEQRLSRLQALQLYTTGSAYAAGEEGWRGTLSVGKQADLTVFDRNLLTVAEDDILAAEVVYTITNGQVAYRK